MNPNPMNPNPSSPMGPSDEVVKGIDTSTHKIFGVPRRAIAFGFGSLLMLVILAVLYTVFTRQPAPMPRDVPMMPSKTDMKNEMKPETSKLSAPAVVGDVTPDRVADDLIDEALSDRDDLSNYDSDEQADVQDGSNN